MSSREELSSVGVKQAQVLSVSQSPGCAVSPISLHYESPPLSQKLTQDI